MESVDDVCYWKEQESAAVALTCSYIFEAHVSHDIAYDR